jgi:DNA modification methylase
MATVAGTSAAGVSSTRLRIDYRSIGTLKPYVNNPRQHSLAQVRKIARSIEAHGWTNPLIVDEEGMILCGHGRLEAAKLLGLEMVPTIRIDHLSEADKRAYIIADNILAEKAGWSRKMLAVELQGLADIGYELELTGMDSLEIDSLLSLEAECEEVDSDDIVELPEAGAPITREGDLWQVGRHRLVCGDARDPLVYERLLDGERAELIFSDPPYGCRIENNVSGLGRVKHRDFVMGAGETSDRDFALGLLRPALRCMAAHAAPGAIAFLCIDWRGAPHLLDAAQGIFEEVKNLIVWAKSNAGMGSFYRSQHELIYAFKVSKGRHINNFALGEGGRHRSNVWSYAGANVFRKGRLEDLADHPTVKPRKLVADALIDCSTRGGVVLDSFCGSGTTLIAAEMTGRRGRGIEIDPHYCDVILRRLEKETGKPALLNGEMPFAAVAAERHAATRRAGI